MFMLGLILLCTVVICVRSRLSRKTAGFSRLNFDDDEDDLEDYYDNGPTKKFINKEYHDYSSDEEDMFDKKLLNESR